MKLIYAVILLAAISSACSNIRTEAQIRSTGNGKVVNTNPVKPTPPVAVIDLSTIDFANYTFPEIRGEKVFTLKNGRTERKLRMPAYNLRKTYLFDITGDENDEAISHILADGCDFGCESSNFFYIFTPDGNQARLLWKIGIGGDTLGGLKAASFKINEIILETFGNCINNNGIIKPLVDLKKNPGLKTNTYTRFVFKRNGSEYIETEREILPLGSENLEEYRPQITFGEDQ